MCSFKGCCPTIRRSGSTILLHIAPNWYFNKRSTISQPDLPYLGQTAYNIALCRSGEMVDAHASGACGATHGGSSPLFGTMSFDHLSSMIRKPGRIGWSVLVVCCLALVFTLLFVSQEKYLHFWDEVTFQNEYVSLAATLRQDGISAALRMIITSVGHEYSLFPVVLPAMIPFLPLNRLSFIGLNTLFYYIPWLLLTSYYLATNVSYPQIHWKKIFLGSSLFLSLLPFVWRPLLDGMPDIGGVAIASLILILYRRRYQNNGVQLQFLSGVLLVIIVLFRRYFAFWSLGFISSYLIMILVEKKLHWKQRLAPFWSLLAGSGITFVLAGPPFWQMLTKNYGHIYQGYQAAQPLQEFWFYVTFICFGIPIVLSCLVSAAVLVRNHQTRQTSAFLLILTTIAVCLFMRVQSFAPHHFMLFLPLVSYLLIQGGVLAYVTFSRTRHLRRFISAVALFQITAFSVAFIPNPLHRSPLFDSIWPVYAPPLQRNDLQSINEICGSLTRLTDGGQTIYVLSSSDILNQSILENACHNNSFLRTEEVDVRDEFPQQFFTADIVITANPIQLHIESDKQQLITTLHQHFHTQLSQFYQLESQYLLDHDVTAGIYLRTANIPTPISAQIEAEYSQRHIKE